MKIEFQPALMNVEQAESANLITATSAASVDLATKDSRPRCCGESAINPNLLEM